MTIEEVQKLMEQVYTEHGALWDNGAGKVNVLVAGVTGSGKSTLVNAFFGTELAATGVGASVTQALERFTVPGKPVTVYDTRGFETGDTKAVDLVAAQLEKLRNATSADDQLHIVWLCVDQSTARFEKAHQAFLAKARGLGLPAIVVVTRSTDDPGAFEQELLRLVGLDTRIVNVLALDKPIKGGVIPAEGLGRLLDATLSVVPEDRRTAFVAAQMVSWAAKDREANLAITAAVTASAGAALIPVPGGQLVALGGIQAALMLKLDMLAGLPLKDKMLYAKAAGLAAARAGGTRLFGLAFAQVVKLVPGVGTAAGAAIGAGIASTVTGTLGAAYWLAAKAAVRAGTAVTPDILEKALAQQRAAAGMEPRAA